MLEWGQKKGHDVQYKVLSKFKMDHRDRYRVVVTVNGEELSTAEDFNKKNAEQQASELALAKLGIKEVTEI